MDVLCQSTIQCTVIYRNDEYIFTDFINYQRVSSANPTNISIQATYSLCKRLQRIILIYVIASYICTVLSLSACTYTVSMLKNRFCTIGVKNR